jgi:hypothetical protein
MKKLLLTGIAVLLLATGTAHAKSLCTEDMTRSDYARCMVDFRRVNKEYFDSIKEEQKKQSTHVFTESEFAALPPWERWQCVDASFTTRVLHSRRKFNKKEREAFVTTCVEDKWQKNWYELD